MMNGMMGMMYGWVLWAVLVVGLLIVIVVLLVRGRKGH